MLLLTDKKVEAKPQNTTKKRETVAKAFDRAKTLKETRTVSDATNRNNTTHMDTAQSNVSSAR